MKEQEKKKEEEKGKRKGEEKKGEGKLVRFWDSPQYINLPDLHFQ